MNSFHTKINELQIAINQYIVIIKNAFKIYKISYNKK